MVLLKKIFLCFSKNERLVFWISSGAFAVSLLVIFGIVLNNNTKIVPASGGKFVEGIVGQPAFINPVLSKNEADKSLVRLLFANLPVLAEKIESDGTGRVWNVRLKENLYWTNNEKLTSDDVIFTIQKIQDPETQSPLYLSWQGVAANRLSELEIQLNLVTPYAFFYQNLNMLFPMPKHIFADTPSANWKLSDYNLDPVGSGPFKFKSKDKHANGFIDSYHLTNNENYAGGKVLINDYYLNFFTKSEDLVKAFNSAAIDGFSSMDPVIAKGVNRPHETFSFKVPSYYAVFFNQSQNLALKEKAVREALSLAADRNSMVREIFENRARVIYAPFMENEVREDLELAKGLLEEAGWKIGENNVREKSVKNDKILLELKVTVPKVAFLVETAEMLAREWGSLGVKTEIVQIDPDKIVNETIKNREYQALLFGNFLNPAEDFYPFWHTNERFYPGLNLSMYSNPEADKIIEAMRREGREEERAKGIASLLSIIESDSPAIFLYSPEFLFISDKNLRGVNEKMISDPVERYAGINEWHTKTARALK